MPTILRNEGGFVNDPDDPGGATKYGVSLRTLRKIGDLDFDLDVDGDIDMDDIKLLTPEKAEEFYYEYFYQPIKIDGLKCDSLALQVFDMSINAGKVTAIKLLQQVVGSGVDGIIGPKTIACANTFTDDIGEAFRSARKQWYKNLVSKKPVFKKFLNGWLHRCDHTKI
jgi:lysozyme family protein